jgi:hypothetical protein
MTSDPIVRDVRGIPAWLMRRAGLGAITMPWRRVYVLPEYGRHEGLLMHEFVHIQQIERDGAWLFVVRYLWWLVRYGYRRNPYEIEAYALEPIEGDDDGRNSVETENASAEGSGPDACRGG